MPPPSPGPDELRVLAAKYRALAALRARRDSESPADRRTLQALAREHPGCLRELDTLGLPELDRRAAAVAAAADGGPGEPWMSWVWAYHRLMKATLLVKGGGTPLDEAARVAGWPLEPGFLDEVAHPPEGRLGVLVLRRLGRLFGVPAADIARTLFPPRRASPYTLDG